MSLIDPAAINVVRLLTATEADMKESDVIGRNVWGRVAFRRPGYLHIEVLPRDAEVNDSVMGSFTPQELALDRKARYKLYRERCRAKAASFNEEAIREHALTLLLSSNGQLTKRGKALAEGLLWEVSPSL